MRLKDKRVLVTGAAQGIGLAIASLFLREGANVMMLDRQEDVLEEAASELAKQYPSRVETIVCDMTDAEQVKQAAEQAWDHFDGLDVLINNAGTATREPFLDLSLDVWDRIVNVNLRGMFVLSQEISRRMVAENLSGSIVNMSSKNGLAGSSMLTHYNASKGGVQLLTQSMAVELAPHQIRVNAVAPGFIDTPLDRSLKKKSNNQANLNLTNRTPMKRLGRVEEVAYAFLFLASDEASYITGSTIVVDGGHMANGGEI